MIVRKLKRNLILAGTIAALALPFGLHTAAEEAEQPQVTAEKAEADEEAEEAGQTVDSEGERVLQWLSDKAESGDVDLSDEESILHAIDEAEEEFGVSLDEKERDRIVSTLQKLDRLGIGTEEMLEQAKKLYQKYGEEIVHNANDAINEAVEDAVKSATDNFFQSMKSAVQGFFKDLFSK